MGRQVRMVPKDWKHPKDAKGNHIPLLDGLCNYLFQWHREKAMWDIGFRQNCADDNWIPIEPEYQHHTFQEWHGEMPDPEDFMPDWPSEARTHMQMYEDTSEGTPISPVMETPEELARWLADNNASAFGDMTATYEQWLATCKSGWAPSGVITVHSDGTGTMQSGVEAMKDD